jgi:hypothetical protein
METKKRYLFDDIIMQVADDHGCYRPVSAWPTPGWGNSGMGKHEKLTEENKDSFRWPAYMSVAIFFHEKPSQKMLDVIKERVPTFVEHYKNVKFGTDITVTGFRLVRYEVIRKETEEPI